MLTLCCEFNPGTRTFSVFFIVKKIFFFFFGVKKFISLNENLNDKTIGTVYQTHISRVSVEFGDSVFKLMKRSGLGFGRFDVTVLPN